MKTKFFLLAFSQIYCTMFGLYLFAQRGGGNFTCITANAGANKTICSSQSTTIGENISSINYKYSWTPSTGLSSATVAQPTASPSQTTTYTLTMTPKFNLLDNGDFENGNTGFGTDYTYDITTNNYQTYEIVNNPINVYSWWCNVFPSSGNNMLVIDGATSSSVRVWYQTVSVQPNTTYNFAGQFINFYSTNGNNDPNIVVTINGTMIYNSALPYSNCMWTTMNEIWQSGENDYTAEIVIYANPNVSGNGNGNDLAIDNLSFTAGECTMTSSTVTINVDQKPVISPAGPIEWCYVYDGIVPLTLSSSPASSYQWYKNGIAISGATQQNLTEQNLGWDPVTFQPRSLIYTVANSCQTSDPVTVIAKAFNNISTIDQFTTGITSVGFRFNKYAFWDQTTSNFSYEITNPGTLLSETQNSAYTDINTSVQNGTSYPATYRVTLNVWQFGCLLSDKFDITINGINWPDIDYIPSSYSKKIPINQYSILKLTNELSENSLAKDLSLFPNPTSTHVTINTKKQFIGVQLFNSNGILKRSYNSQGLRTKLNVSGLPAGLYYLKILFKNSSLTEKLLITK